MATRQPQRNVYRSGQTYVADDEFTRQPYTNNDTSQYEGTVPYPGRNTTPPVPSPRAPKPVAPPKPVLPPGGGGPSGGGGGSSSGGSTGGAGGGRDLKLMSGQELADLFGFTFGEEAIRNILQTATNAKFDEMDAQTRGVRDQQLTDYSSSYNQYLQNSRNQRQSALKNGLSKGTAVASEVMSQLSAQQGGAQNQQMYQQQLGDINYQRGSQLASDHYNAMTTQNDLATTLGGMGINQYGNEVQHDAARMSLQGQLAQAAAQSAMANAQRYSTDQTLAYQREQGTAATQQQNLLYDTFVKAGYDQDLAQGYAHGQMTWDQIKTEQDRRTRDRQPKPKPMSYNQANTSYDKFFNNGGF